MKPSKLFALVTVLLCIALTSCQSQMLSAKAVEDTLRPVLQRHEAILNGTLDPATISVEDKITYRRSGYLLLLALETSLGNPPPPVPAGLVINTPAATPPTVLNP